MAIWVSWALFTLAFVYNILDVWHTKLLLNVGATEINPLMNYFIKGYGVDSLFGVKIVVFLCLGIILWIHQIQFKKAEGEIDLFNRQTLGLSGVCQNT